MSSNNDNTSKVSAIKDQALGTIKETVGNLIGNEKMELKGKAQKVHGKNELAYVKAHKNGEEEPEHFQEAHSSHHEHAQHTSEQITNPPVQATNDVNNPPQVPPHPQNVPHPQQIPVHQPTGSELPAAPPVAPIPGAHPVAAPVAPLPNQSTGNAVPPAPPQNQNFNAPPIPPSVATGAVPPPPPGNINQHAEGSVEGDHVSKMGALKDKTMGSIKESLGSATGNQNMEIQGKAQNIHGHNQDEFVKAQQHGLNEPSHFEHGTKINHEQHAEGTVEGQHQPSSLNGLKDQTMGSIKQSYGSATGNMNTELAGAAQKIHGKNESEFAKAQNQGLNEPAHFERGTRINNTAEGQVVGDNEPSKVSGYFDQAVGTVKEMWGSTTGNQNLEIAGKAQKIHGSTEAQTHPANA